MNIFYCEQLTQETAVLSEEESKHCTQVMRKKVGDTIHLFDGKGTKAVGEINHIGKKMVQLTIVEKKFTPPDDYFLHIAVSPTKQINKIEWFLEKAIEFGVHEVTFLESKHTERPRINMQRMQKIAMAATKQSLAAYLPKLNDLTSFKEFISKNDLPKGKYIATLHEETSTFDYNQNDELVALIGPEGGFTEKEVEQAITQGFQPVLLGHKRLRTETAALFFASAMYQKNLNK